MSVSRGRIRVPGCPLTRRIEEWLGVLPSDANGFDSSSRENVESEPALVAEEDDWRDVVLISLGVRLTFYGPHRETHDTIFATVRRVE